MMRWIAIVALLLPSIAAAQSFALGEFSSGPRILGEPAFAFELDALTPDEVTRPGWPVTTTRASPCMSYDGTTWHTQPANTACVGRWGLEAFGAFTNYWVRSATPELWTTNTGTATWADAGGGWWQVTDTDAASYVGRRAGIAAATDGVYTVTCEVRRGTMTDVRLRVHPGTTGGAVSGGECVFSATIEGSRLSCSGTLSGSNGAGELRGIIDFGYEQGESSTGGTMYVRQCQLTKTATPMPRHDCDASPCTRAADVHTVSTEGWPVEAGRIDFEFTGTVTSGVGVILDTRSAESGLSGVVVFLSSTDGWRVQFADATTLHPILIGPPDDGSGQYSGSIRWGDDGVSIAVNGVATHYSSVPPFTHSGTAVIGANRLGFNRANGSIRLLRVGE